MKKRTKRIPLIVAALSCAIIVVMVACGKRSDSEAKEKPYEDVDSIPNREMTDSIGIPSGYLSVSNIKTENGDLICLKPDMSKLSMDLVCNEIPSAENDSIILAFAGTFTGTGVENNHDNIAGDHVSSGTRFSGYYCKRCNGAFTWSPASGPQFFYQNYSSKLDKAAQEGGMGFTQEMMIHNGKAVKTTRPAENQNVFRALCLDADGELAIYESQRNITFGNFIDALLSQGVKEALYTDMGPGWNYCFYRINLNEKSPRYLHDQPMADATNFVILKIK